MIRSVNRCGVADDIKVNHAWRLYQSSNMIHEMSSIMEMEFEVIMKLVRDSWNSYPGSVQVKGGHGDNIQFDLGDRVFEVNAEQLQKVISLMLD